MPAPSAVQSDPALPVFDIKSVPPSSTTRPPADCVTRDWLLMPSVVPGRTVTVPEPMPTTPAPLRFTVP